MSTADGPAHPTAAGTSPGATPLTELSARRLGPVRRWFARHPRGTDLLVMAWFGLPTVLLALVSLAVDAPDGELRTRLVVAGLVLPALGVTALFWRRRYPVAVTASHTVLGVLSLATVGATGGFELGLALGLYAVAAARPPQVTWTVLGLTTAAFGGAVWLWEEEVVEVTNQVTDAGPVLSVEAARATTVSFALVTVLLAVAIGTSVRNRRLHVADLVAHTEELARERDRRARLAQAAERTRIAREMHDVVAHSISVMIALADGAEASVERAPDRARVAIDELAATGRGALADMRRVLGVLDPGDAVVDAGDDLGAVVERFRTAGLPIRVTGLATLREQPPADPGLELAARRIVSEALTNVLRHAPGTPRVDLALRSEGGTLVVEVTDRGPTLPVRDAGGAGQGVIGMRERAEVHGGRVEAGPWDSGWRVRAELPWPPADEEGTGT